MVYSRNFLARFSRFDSKTVLLDLIARLIQKFVGLLSGSVCMRVKERRILLCNLRCGGANDVSISSAVVAVVLKVPNIAFIAIRCAVSSLLICPGRCVWPYLFGRCQIVAA